MPRGVYSNLKCPEPTETNDTKFVPTEHQIKTLDFFLKSPYKGLLLFHKVGSGKSMTSILIANRMLQDKRVKHVFIITPGSLRQVWINEYCKVSGYTPEILQKYYTFITYNYMVSVLPDLDGSLVIIDEVHNLINGTRNRSKYPTFIYNTIDKANCKILALSGTAIYNYTDEFSLLGRLLKPGPEFPDIRKGSGELDKQAFMKFFTVEKDGTLSQKIRL